MRLLALPGYLLLSFNSVSNGEVSPQNGNQQNPEDKLQDKDSDGDDEYVKEEECEHDDIFLRVNNYVV